MELDSPESAQAHIDLTNHKNFEMVASSKKFIEDFDHSSKLKKGSQDWQDQAKQEFRQIFEQSDDKFFEIFHQKISSSKKSLFLNTSLKQEIYTFIMAQNKTFKCHNCKSQVFESWRELKSHIEKSKKCKMTEAHKYLFSQ
jgi:hypothetical protein